MGSFILYGANGYTGELIAEEAKRRGLRPILAGRREEAIRPIAERLGLERRVFPLDAPSQIARGLDGVSAVLLCAGPFSRTSAPMVEACLQAKVHYLDITGEIPVFEACHRLDGRAKERGVVLLPGVGFDVVPSDCLALALKEALPDAVSLELAFAGSGGALSPGTAKTSLEGMSHGGAIRVGGVIRRVPVAHLSMDAPFKDKPRHVVSIPWGDVSTAYQSTGIPNIVVFIGMSRGLERMAKLARPLMPLVALGPLQRFIARQIDRKLHGPDERKRREGSAHLWGRAKNAAGREVEGTLETPEGYSLTVKTALESVLRVADGVVPPGAKTPAMAFGARYIAGFEGCELEIGPVR